VSCRATTQPAAKRGEAGPGWLPQRLRTRLERRAGNTRWSSTGYARGQPNPRREAQSRLFKGWRLGDLSAKGVLYLGDQGGQPRPVNSLIAPITHVLSSGHA
jgi:hypothetical protein